MSLRRPHGSSQGLSNRDTIAGVFSSALIIGAFALAGVVGAYRWIRRLNTPIVEEFDAQFVAVMIWRARNARLRRDDEPLRVVAVLRRADGAELRTGPHNPAHLPGPVKKQVFSPALVVNVFEPNLALPAAELALARRQAQEPEGYRFDLPHPVPVRCTRDRRDEVRWTLR